jgi:hypothetical protein
VAKEVLEDGELVMSIPSVSAYPGRLSAAYVRAERETGVGETCMRGLDIKEAGPVFLITYAWIVPLSPALCMRNV